MYAKNVFSKMFSRCFYTTDVFQIKRSLTEILDIYLHCLSFYHIYHYRTDDNAFIMIWECISLLRLKWKNLKWTDGGAS